MKLLRLFASFCILFLTTGVIHAQFFTLPGDFGYALNSIRQVFDVSQDGKIAVALRNDPVSGQPAFLTSFDPIFGTQFDNKTFGFGPLGVQLAPTSNGVRVVVLTSEGGPRRIYLFDLSAAGKLTQLASTQLTSSGTDFGSNLILSGSAEVGFVIVASSTCCANDLITFSLVDGSILNRVSISGGGDTLAMNEVPGKRVLAFLKDLNTLELFDATISSQPMKIGDVPFPKNNEASGSQTAGIALSGDGHYVFVGDQFADFAAIDVFSLQTISTIVSASYRFGRVRVFEDGQHRTLALQSSPSGTGGVSAILLIDATDPFHLSIINQLNFTSDSFIYKSDFAFSKNGSRLFVQINQKLSAYDLTAFTKAWEEVATTSFGRENQLMVYGNDEVLGAWEVSGGLGFVSLFGAFPGYPPNISISDVALNEGDTGTSDATFGVTLSGATTHRITINYATADATAIQGTDYLSTNGSLIFEPGETTKSFTVSVLGDVLDEFDETFDLNLTSATVGIITRGQGTCTIIDDDPPPSISINDTSVIEGNLGTHNAGFSVNLSATSGKPIAVDYSTSDGTAIAGTDYISSFGTLTFAAGQTVRTILVPVIGDKINEPDETFFVTFTNPQNVTIARAQATGIIVNDDTPTIQLSSPNYTVSEGDGRAHITVTRNGDTSGAATVDYRTTDTDTFTVGCADTVNNHGSAYARCDFATVVGTLTWAAGDGSPKSFDVPIIDDSYAEGNETFIVVLSNATGAMLGLPATATVTIVDNDTVNGPNPIVQTNDAGIAFFVRQHYLDFLGREPEVGEPWSAILRGCADQFNTDPSSPSAACDRITVSGDFFGSPEFKDKGFFVIDFYRVAFARLPQYSEFVTDLASLVGTTAQEVFARRAAFANNFVQRPEFATLAGKSNSDYVNALMTGTMSQGYNLTSITTPDPDNPDGMTKVTLTTTDLINRLNANTLTRGQVLRAIVQSDQIVNIEAVSTFVASQYYGYLRRTPEPAGFNDWVNYLTMHPTDFRTMVNGFENSQEYRLRVGPT
jgi:Calx-beta domain